MKKFFCGFLVGILVGLAVVYIRIVKVKTTAYCACVKCCGIYAGGTTSTGRDAKKIMGVAIDPKVFNYGDWFHIRNIGWRKADDTGGAMRQSTKKGVKHIDIRMPTHQEALDYGVKQTYALILRSRK